MIYSMKIILLSGEDGHNIIMCYMHVKNGLYLMKYQSSVTAVYSDDWEKIHMKQICK